VYQQLSDVSFGFRLGLGPGLGAGKVSMGMPGNMSVVEPTSTSFYLGKAMSKNSILSHVTLGLKSCF
jgi:hypothetical protein